MPEAARYLDLEHCFGNWICLLLSDEVMGRHILFGSDRKVEQSGQLRRCVSPEYMNRSIYLNFVFFYEYEGMEAVQKPSNPKCNIALSAPVKLIM